MHANCWLCSSFFPPGEKLTAFHTVITGVRDHGCTMPLQRATFQLSSLARLTPLRAPAAPPQLIDKLPWWVETPCHQLLSQWKSIKNNTHLYPRAQSPFVFPVYQWRVLFYQNVFKQQREKVRWWVGWSWWGGGGGGGCAIYFFICLTSTQKATRSCLLGLKPQHRHLFNSSRTS